MEQSGFVFNTHTITFYIEIEIKLKYNLEKMD